MAKNQKAQVKTSAGQILQFEGPQNDHIMNEMTRKGKVYESEMLEYIAGLKLRGVYLDIGANIGTHGAFFGKLDWADQVHFFEPNPVSLQYLRRNIVLNRLQNESVVHAIGLGDKTSKASLKENIAHNLGSVSTTVNKDGPIVIKRLDDVSILGKVVVATIDVEGFEQAVLLGATNLLLRDKPRLFIEAHNDQRKRIIDNILNPMGFRARQRFNFTPTYEYRYSFANRLLRPGRIHGND